MDFKIILTLIFFSFSNLLTAQEKNVLFIIIDDLKPLLNCYGESQIISPNIDQLAAEGVTFTNAHAQQAVCAPSRVSFMTGMRPDQTKIWELKTQMREVYPEALTIPEYFKQNGYQTAGLGKVLHGAKDNDPQSWTIPFIYDTDLEYAEGFDFPANLNYQNPKIQKRYQELKDQYEGDPNGDNVWFAINKALKEEKLRPTIEMEDIPDNAYSDGAVTFRSIELMKKFQAKNQKFFLTVGFKKPHLPFTAPKKYWDLYDRNKIELAEFQGKSEGTPQFAYHNFGELKNYSDIAENLDKNGNVIESKQRELIHGYYACVTYIDAQVGMLMEHLKSSGLDENTVIILVGDHGWHLGDHGLWNKHSNFEQATRTPLIFAIPKLKGGFQNESPVELIDIFPTTCDLAGLKIPKHLQGTNLCPILKKKKTQVKEFALSQYPRRCHVMHSAIGQWPDNCTIMGYAVRSDRYRYVAWYKGDYETRTNFDESAIEVEEFYNYEKDPLERKNLAKEPDYREIKREMKNFIKATVFGEF
jgi:iduronate 2-sulfatase